MVKRTRGNNDLLLIISALDQGWQVDKNGQLLLDAETRGVYVRVLTRTAEKMAELEEQLEKLEKQKFFADADGKVTPLPVIVRCKECRHKGNPYECRLDRDLEEHGSHRTDEWDDWFCAGGKPKE